MIAAGVIGSGRHAVVPVVTIDDHTAALPLARALVEGGISAVEITFRTGAGAAALARIVDSGLIVAGAGTVVSTGDVRRAATAGAAFAVSPGFDASVVDAVIEAGIECFPGIATPSELQRVLRVGVTVTKVFPAALLGGVPFLTALAAPFPGVRFFPSGGIDRSALADYLAHPSVIAAGCSWIAPRALIAEGAFAEISHRARIATDIAESVRHAGH